ncbi:MAG: inositol monophosphatase family protein [Chloroflexota bacterium]|nr:inositol monophosphatase family protein [Chloroflexota bacterium]
MIDLTPLFPAVRQAVDLTRRVRQLALNASAKGINDPVTIADYGAQAIMLRALERLHPDAAVIAEEHSEQFIELVAPEGRATIAQLLGEVVGEDVRERDIVRWLDFGRDRDDSRLWVLDPIDGTRGYVSGRRYSIALGVLEGRKPAAGFLACPGYPAPNAQGVLFYTSDGMTLAESLAGGAARRVQVRRTTDTRQFQPVESHDNIAFDHPWLLHLYAQLGIPEGTVEQLDGQDKYATVAAGDADFYVRPARPQDRLHFIWDHAAGGALVAAAGGVVTDLTGEPLDFSQGERLPRMGVIVSSAAAHEAVLAGVQALLVAQ